MLAESSPRLARFYLGSLLSFSFHLSVEVSSPYPLSASHRETRRAIRVRVWLSGFHPQATRPGDAAPPRPGLLWSDPTGPPFPPSKDAGVLSLALAAPLAAGTGVKGPCAWLGPAEAPA